MQTASVAAGAAAVAPPRNQADTQTFLRLLITQLQHQDPLNPTTNEDFLAQLAQFQSLEQQIVMTKQNEMILLSTTLASASSLIGKEVEVPVGDEIKFGVVESVVIRDGTARILVAGEEFGLDEIIRVNG